MARCPVAYAGATHGYAQAARGFKLGESHLLRRRFVGIAVQGVAGSRTPRDCPRQVRVVAALGQPVCPCGEPGSRGQGAAFTCPANAIASQALTARHARFFEPLPAPPRIDMDAFVAPPSAKSGYLEDLCRNILRET